VAGDDCALRGLDVSAVSSAQVMPVFISTASAPSSMATIRSSLV
jgi:hypothetical protein